jgi:hypothetical protein
MSNHTIVEDDIAILSIALPQDKRQRREDTPPPLQAPRPQGDECIDSVDLRKHLRYGYQDPKHAKGYPSILR